MEPVFFSCDDEVIEVVLEVLSRGCKVKGDGDNGWKCGWRIRNFSGGDFALEGTEQEAIVLQFIPGVEL